MAELCDLNGRHRTGEGNAGPSPGACCWWRCTSGIHQEAEGRGHRALDAARTWMWLLFITSEDRPAILSFLRAGEPLQSGGLWDSVGSPVQVLPEIRKTDVQANCHETMTKQKEKLLGWNLPWCSLLLLLDTEFPTVGPGACTCGQLSHVTLQRLRMERVAKVLESAQ